MMKIPVSTYRLQFCSTFGFNQAREIASYLESLGVGAVYASPIFVPGPGSEHGYDVVDQNSLDPKLGSREEFETLTEELSGRGIGWIQDFVPNHMAFNSQNRMIVDILENGANSRYYDFFDVEWDHPYENLRGRLLAPFLGRFFGESLDAGEIKLRYGPEGLAVDYFDQYFPIRLESYPMLLGHGLSSLRRELGPDHPDLIKLLGLIYVLKTIPDSSELDERYNQIMFVKKMLWELYESSGPVRAFIERNIRLFNGTPGDPGSFDHLDRLLSEQHFRLSFWKVAAEELNYRRFFNINSLISLRVEEEHVFEHIHRLTFELLSQGRFTGLRIDHIDGLFDPSRYLERLREHFPDTFIVVEKILDPSGEDLPSYWPVQGTTGYEFLNMLNGIFVERSNAKVMARHYSRFTGFRPNFGELRAAMKRLIIGTHMAGDIDNLAHRIKGVAGGYRYGNDITLYSMRRALVEMMAHFPVYRSYISTEHFNDRDYDLLLETIRLASQAKPAIAIELGFIERFIGLVREGSLNLEERAEWLHILMKLQQLTGPLMAKGFEDTLLYVYNRLLSLNEVGGSPAIFGVPTGRFHSFLRNRAGSWPHTLNTTATHDTKRGEDVRARLNVLSELSSEWVKNLRRWSRENHRFKVSLDKRRIPEPNDEYFLYQSLVGHYPLSDSEAGDFARRLKNYLIKAVREAKMHTAWIKPDTEYENAFLEFVDRILEGGAESAFLTSFTPFREKIVWYGMLNSLSQVLIKCAAPGIPDIYQGNELWDFSFVDPDNRRPVDYNRRKAILEKFENASGDARRGLLSKMREGWRDGEVKLFLTKVCLTARRLMPGLFSEKEYFALKTRGRHDRNVVAFARQGEGQRVLCVAGRFYTGVAETGIWPLGESAWGDTHIVLPGDSSAVFHDVISGDRIEGRGRLNVAEAFSQFPGALLIQE